MGIKRFSFAKHQSRKIGAFLLLSYMAISANISCTGQELLKQRIKEHFQNFNRNDSQRCTKTNIAGLSCAVWYPENHQGAAPLVIFSHGFHGINTQSTFIMQALSHAGYLVIAPNHKDAIGKGGFSKPQESFKNASSWTDKTYLDRHDDIVNLVTALKNSPEWEREIDWSRFALAGHSLGGYTVLALAGAWPSWKLPGVKAVLALSPYSQPFVAKNTLSNLKIPVMYQGGTRDFGITPFIKRKGGAYDQTPSPAYFVEFKEAGHFSFSNLNKNRKQEDLMNHYSLAFLAKFVQNDGKASPEQKEAGVSLLEFK